MVEAHPSFLSLVDCQNPKTKMVGAHWPPNETQRSRQASRVAPVLLILWHVVSGGRRELYKIQMVERPLVTISLGESGSYRIYGSSPARLREESPGLTNDPSTSSGLRTGFAKVLPSPCHSERSLAESKNLSPAQPGHAVEVAYS